MVLGNGSKFIRTSTILEERANGGISSVIDGLEASSNWRRKELSKLSDKFPEEAESSKLNGDNDSKIVTKEPLKINSDEELQAMWKNMESRVLRRRTMTHSEAIISGKGIGRKNRRKTDEEAWLEAGLYQQPENSNK